jgi:hypothetical protein
MYYKLPEDNYKAILALFMDQPMKVIEPFVSMMRGLEKVEEIPNEKERKK